MTQGDFFAYVIDVLDELKIPYMITDSVAAMAYGEPRLTLDMDVVINLSENMAQEFCNRFGNDFYADLEGILEAIRQKGHFNILHIPSGPKVDFYLLKTDKVTGEMFGRRKQESFDEKREAFFSSPEDGIINKLIFYKEGKNEKHLSDIRAMLRISGDKIDLSYIDKETRELELHQYWKKLRPSSS